MSSPVALRVVFDTNIVISALVFSGGRLAWLRSHWSDSGCVPLLYTATAAELRRVLAYPKLMLLPDRRLELLGDYLPFCETIAGIEPCPILCRDPKDQMFLDLAYTAKADALVTGDEDLLVLASQANFRIETPESYRQKTAASR